MSVVDQWSGDEKLDTFVIKAGDQKPVLGVYLKYANGTVRNLTSHTVKLVVASAVGGRRLIDGVAMTVVGTPTDGYVEYQWAVNQLIAGEYLMEIQVFDGSTPALRETFPKGGYFKLVIEPNL